MRAQRDLYLTLVNMAHEKELPSLSWSKSSVTGFDLVICGDP